MRWILPVFLLLSLSGCRGRTLCDLEPCVPSLCCEGWTKRPCVIEEHCEVAYDFTCAYEHEPVNQTSFCPIETQEKEYRISAGDMLEISAYSDNEAIVNQVKVAPDGKVYFSFFEGIEASGKTTDELKVIVKEKMSKVFLSPSVTISPLESVGNRFLILGRVKNPGSYPLQSRTTLRQAFGIAGGLLSDREAGYDGQRALFNAKTWTPNSKEFSSVANLKKSFIIRDGQKLAVDFEKVLYTADASGDIKLQAGDYIYIAEDYKNDIYILGAVKAPRAIAYDEGMTLMGAFASSGGWRMGGPYGADMRKVLILRGDLECPDVICVDLCMILGGCGRDVVLQPGDIIYVYNKQFRFGRELVRLAINTFVITFADDMAQYVADKYIFDRLGDDD